MDCTCYRPWNGITPPPSCPVHRSNVTTPGLWPNTTTTGTSGAAVHITTTYGHPVTLHYWTWREAIEVASRLTDTDGRRATLRREGDQWALRYYARLRLINCAS